jgi:hydroxymethylglutaryl-CoA lyase
METVFIPTEIKVEIINLISASGVPRIEATSFVSPKVIPQMADADQVMEQIKRKPGTKYTALVPNLRGMERALAAQADAIRLVICATETYNQRNVGLSIDQSIGLCSEMLNEAGPNGCVVEVVIAVAFGCPFEGRVEAEQVFEMSNRLTAAGVQEISIADSVGVANPGQIERLMTELQLRQPTVDFSLHLHDTRGLGLANVLAALSSGIDTFDSSIGGLGGCPITSVSSGNIASDDLIHMLEEMGIETGIDLGGLRAASRCIGQHLNRQLPSRVLAAGTRQELFDRAASKGS